jgi:superfamily II DNA/RNA helicase
MTPIQEKAIVQARRGKDILAIAQTGTGKTAAFAIPILQRLADKKAETKPSMPHALILTPTRELAEQLAETIGAYAQFLEMNIVAVYGGGKMPGQAAKMKSGVDILIATPGRLMEHVADNNVALSSVDYLVLDESDRMLDMGFINDVGELMKRTKSTRQTMLFSATLSPAVNELSHKILKNHEEIRANAINAAADTVSHVVYPVE